MLETVYECSKLIFSFNLSGFRICKGLLHCREAAFLGSGVMLMRGIHTREGSEGGNRRRRSALEILVGGKSGLGNFSRQSRNRLESAL